jgi:hypothetical protein
MGRGCERSERMSHHEKGKMGGDMKGDMGKTKTGGATTKGGTKSTPKK